MKARLKCIFSACRISFTQGNEYEADLYSKLVIGNDGDREDPWELTGLEVKVKNSVLAKFEQVA